MLGRNVPEKLGKCPGLLVREGSLNILLIEDREHEYSRIRRMAKPLNETVKSLSNEQQNIIETIRSEKGSLLKT